ncbi:MAG TPA: TolC family protein [Rubricoccaceae bacterium]|jgi:outer membrane protein TolC
MSRRISALFLFTALAVPAAAQSVRPDSLPPLPPTIRLYGENLPTGADLPALDAPGAIAITLAEAVALALERNPGQRVSALEAVRARTDVTRGNAGYGVGLDATASAGGQRSDTFGGGGSGGGTDSTGTGGGNTGGSGGSRATTTASAGLALSTVLIDGGGRAAALRRLQLQARQAAFSADADAEALVLATASAYLDVARQAGLVDALAEAVDVSTDRLRISAAEVRIGTAAEVDAAIALTDLNADRSALLRGRIALAAARATLGGLLALPDPDAVTAADPLALDPAPDLPRLEAAAVAGNRRVRQSVVAQDVAEAITEEVRARYRPQVGASVGASLAATDTGFLPPSFNPAVGPAVRYGFTFSVPILDRGERRRELDVAAIRVLQAEAATADAEAGVRSDAARFAASARGFRALAALETQNERVARQNVRVALAQLQLGLITPIDLRLVQLSLVDVRTRLVEAVFQTRSAEASLRALAGVLLPPEAAVAETPLGETALAD